MKWMRRSRFVAREFANTKRHDTYSPATGSHTNNLIPILFLQMWSQLEASGSNDENNRVVLASLDIKDAFLQVPQENVVEVQLHGTSYVVLRNLPGQRLGARAWYWFFRNFATDAFKCSWSDIQPCIGKCAEGVFTVHVDDLLFTGNAKYWRDVFLPTMQEKFSISHNVLDLEGSEISFLKRRFVRLRDGLLVIPGTTVEKVLGCFEKYFGAARIQKTPCDAGIQQEDMSKELGLYESGCYRSIIGLLLYLARDRVDIMFTVKELATSMSKPTLCSLQRLRKLMGYLRFTGDMGMKLSMPEFGKGKRKEGCESEWILETFTDADWSSNKAHRKSTSCAVHFLRTDALLSLLQGPKRSSASPQQNQNSIAWFLDVVMEFSSSGALSFFLDLPSSTSNGRTTVLPGSWWRDRELEGSDTCLERSFGYSSACWMEMSLWDRCQR